MKDGNERREMMEGRKEGGSKWTMKGVGKRLEETNQWKKGGRYTEMKKRKKKCKLKTVMIKGF